MSIIIRAYQTNDFDLIYKLRNDFGLQYLLMSHPRPNTKTRLLEWIENKTNDQDSVFFIISNSENDTIGFIQATKINTINRTCYIGIALLEEWRGKGIFKDALALMESYLKDTFSIRKIIAEILFKNTNSIKAFENQGYKQAGILKEHFYYSSSFNDVLIFEKLI